MQDVLNLNYSPSFDIQGMQEADINLSLSPSVAASATVYGTVTDGTNPLPNATVKLFDSLGVPYRHVMTDVAGAYSFDNVPAGTYSIAAALDGYIMSPSSLLTLSSGSSLEVPLVCRSEAALALGAIAGTATTIGLAGSAPVAGATVTLRNLAGTAVATTRTADDGEFGSTTWPTASTALSPRRTATRHGSHRRDHSRGLHCKRRREHGRGQPHLQRHGQRHHPRLERSARVRPRFF
ncbi:MAG: collagen binding domain-containing protein [Oscillospiraceae bacterium]